MRQFCSKVRRWPTFGAIGALSVALSCGAQTISPDPIKSPAGASLLPVTHGNVLDQRISFWQTHVSIDPDYWGNYNQLASAYAQKARETGDIEYLSLAEDCLKKSLQLESNHAEAAPAYIQLATVHLAEHRFLEASQDATRATLLQPGNLLAYTNAGDAQLELGNYAEAKAFYEKLIVPSDGLPHAGVEFLAASHGANLSWLEGNTDQAMAALQSAVALSQKLHLPAENAAWTEFMLGEQYLQTGNIPSAEREEVAALLLFPHYHRALSAMAQIRAAQGRLSEAITFYKEAIAIIPLPLYLGALGDAYAAIGDSTDAEKQYSVVEFIGKLSAINKQVYNRELALFYADHERHLEEALTLSRQEFECRHDIYTSDALAWVLFKNGQAGSAKEEMKTALRLGTKDAMLEFHAGMIDDAVGDKVGAITHLKRAIEINPHFHIVFAGQAARALARLRRDDTPLSTERGEEADADEH